MKPLIREEQYIEAIMFFISECQNAHLGKTKLMKLIYFLDATYYRRHGRKLTRDEYVKLQFGPVPINADRIIEKMHDRGHLVHVSPKRKLQRHRYIPKRPLRPDVFRTGEYQAVMDVIDQWGSASRDEIVEASHEQAPWALTESLGDRIRTSLMSESHIPVPVLPVVRPESPPEQDTAENGSTSARYSRQLTDVEKQALLRCVISSESLEGIVLTKARAKRMFEEALEMPLVDL